MFNVNFDQFSSDNRFGRVYKQVTGQPAWVWGIPLTIGSIVFVVPLILLAGAALITVGLTYIITRTVYNIIIAFTGKTPPDGRKNVRVLHPEDH